jgi:flagellar basal-body rod protein FlgB
MQGGIESLTVPALSLALDAAVMRQQAIASNIANAHTVGYVPQRLSFEAEISRAWQSQSEAAAAPSPNVLALRVRSEPVAADQTSGGAVHLDQEIAALAQNSTHYQVLLRGLNRHLSVLASAVSEGKR